MISNLMLSATQNFKAGPVDPFSQSPMGAVAHAASTNGVQGCAFCVVSVLVMERPQLRKGTEIPKKQLQASLDYWEMRGIDVLRVGGMTGD